MASIGHRFFYSPKLRSQRQHTHLPKKWGRRTKGNEYLSYAYDYYDATGVRRYLTPGQTLPAGATRATNRLNFVNDGVTTHTGNDIEDQSANNYSYDETGNLTKDVKERITNIEWTVYCKIKKITKSTGTVEYTYDAAGNRISKTANNKTTVYVRDATGNVMSVYEQTGSGTTAQIETDLYGSSRLGLQTAHTVPDVNITLANGDIATLSTFTRGEKIFELSNHLGNVLVTVNDKKVQHTTDNSTVDYWEADVMSANDYYPFGMSMPGRGYNASSYRYGFNGQEKSDEIAIGLTTALFWEYDSRTGRRWNVDPVLREWESSYATFENNPISKIDPNGDDPNPFRLIFDLSRTFIPNTTASVVAEYASKVGFRPATCNLCRVGRVYEGAVLGSMDEDKNTRTFKSNPLKPGVRPEVVGNTHLSYINPVNPSERGKRLEFTDAHFTEVKMKSYVSLREPDRENGEQLKTMIDILSEKKGGTEDGRPNPNLKASDYGMAILTIITPANGIISPELIQYATSKNVQLYQRTTEQDKEDPSRIRVAKGVIALNAVQVSKGVVSVPGVLSSKAPGQSQQADWSTK